MDTIQRLAAAETIRQAAARYSRGVDRLDVELMQSAYWPDATDDHGVYVGPAMPFCERVVSTHARYRSTMHCLLNHAIEVAAFGEEEGSRFPTHILTSSALIGAVKPALLDAKEARALAYSLLMMADQLTKD